MGGWTRILHEGHPDRLMKELNTFIAEPHPHAGMYEPLSPSRNNSFLICRGSLEIAKIIHEL